ncbi:chitinase [Corallococcus sp. CAG:1435]|nr:chitinase [Corallococcus sp. CAG:1435]
MKKTKLIVAVLLAVVMVLALGLVACDKHECEHVCPICGKCTDPDCADPVCADKCPGHEVQHAAPQISVNPTEIEINAGDEIDLMFGVTVTDAEDDNPTLIIFDDDDFDADTEGVYTITYKATNKFGLEATATRTVTVNQALSALALEVRQNLLGEAKWEGVTISFKHSLYVELSADTDYDVARSGVFHNTSDGEIVLNVAAVTAVRQYLRQTAW